MKNPNISAALRNSWKTRDRSAYFKIADELKERYSQLSEADIAWAAGFFEGEGCITSHRDYGRLTVHSTDQDVLERFHGIMGGRLYGPKILPPPRKPIYTWQLFNTACVAVAIKLLLPYLGNRRRERATEVLNTIARLDRT